MSTVRGTYMNGRIVFDAPPDWPDGTEVQIRPAAETAEVGVTEEEQGDDPESIARWLAWYDSLEPLIITPDDEARIRQAREDQKAFELASWADRSAKLENLFK